MKIRGLIYSLILTGSLISMSFYSNAQKSSTTAIDNASINIEESQATMNLSATTDDIIIQYTNSDMEYLTFVIYREDGTLLMELTTTQDVGEFVINNSELVAMGGTGEYYVEMLSGDGKKKTESGTVVIVRE